MKFNISFPLLLILALGALYGENILSLILSAVIHETGHTAALLALGSEIKEIKANLKGIAVKMTDKGIKSAKDIIFLNLMGPLAGIIGGIIAWFLYFKDFAKINFFLSLFNLLPFKGLDGGEIFEEISFLNSSKKKSTSFKLLWSLIILALIYSLDILSY